jgi:hypothetical protein
MIQLTDAMISLGNTLPFYGMKFEGRSFDCGSKVGFLTANVAYALAAPIWRRRSVKCCKRLFDRTRRSGDKIERKHVPGPRALTQTPFITHRKSRRSVSAPN